MLFSCGRESCAREVLKYAELHSPIINRVTGAAAAWSLLVRTKTKFLSRQRS